MHRRLDVGERGPKEPLRALAGEILHFVDGPATAVVALAGKALGVLVRERTSHRLHHGEGHEVLGRDELDGVALATEFLLDETADLAVLNTQLLQIA